jgi:hypothetical protein
MGEIKNWHGITAKCVDKILTALEKIFFAVYLKHSSFFAFS